MKLVCINVHFEHADVIEQMLDELQIADYLFVEATGRDREGKHDGTQVFPGHFVLVLAHVADDRVDALLEQLRRFRDARPAHRHIEAVVTAVERRLSDEHPTA